MSKYKAILFHPSGDYVIDFTNSNSIEDVWDKINDMGSKWIFYPICFVIGDNVYTKDSKILGTCDGLEGWKNKTVQTIKQFFETSWEKNADKICKEINDGIPIGMIYEDYLEF